jgi:pimeloyl-ACP methyl ester carboxylesterase
MNCPSHVRCQLAGESYALLTDDDSCNTAIVFVHGFWGHSEKTWWQFQTLPDRLNDPWWHSCDLIFYSYDSTGAQIWPNISALGKFLHNVFPAPAWKHLGSSIPGPGRTYRNIVLVGHSEGAVLVRGAVLERSRLHLQPPPRPQSVGAKKMQDDRLLHADLCLFAPALFGALICGWKGVLLKSPVLGSLVEAYLNKSPAYKQLQSDSPVLRQIRSETEDLARDFPELTAFRARNYFGNNDSVASICSLPTDLQSEYETGKNHVSVCKPSMSYLRPLTFIGETRRAKAA